MEGGSRREPDPLDGVVFDEAFVAGAGKREDSAAERQARAQRAAAARRDLEQRAVADRKRARRTLRRRRTRTISGVVAVLVLLAGVAWFSSWLSDRTGGVGIASNDLLTHDPQDADHHPIRLPPASDTPLGTPAPTNGADGPHVFLQTGPGGNPAAYNPCRAIAVVINPRTQPAGGEQAVMAALAEVTQITGLHFTVEGQTDEKPTDGRSSYQPERYGDRWAPVLVAWSDPAEAPRLGGDTAGFAGSAPRVAGSEYVYVSGTVSLDGPDFTEIATRSDGAAEMKAIVLHELGHLVGLDHVNDEKQLMYPENSGQLDFGVGDRAGLARLGSGPCVDP